MQQHRHASDVERRQGSDIAAGLPRARYPDHYGRQIGSSGQGNAAKVHTVAGPVIGRVELGVEIAPTLPEPPVAVSTQTGSTVTAVVGPT
jgi:hypothetical protein